MTINSSFSTQSYIDNDSKGRPPRYDGNNFQLWKGRILLFLRAQDPLLIRILNEGPYIPHTIFERIPTATDGSEQDSSRSIVKPISQWSDEDKHFVDIDFKLQSFLVMFLSNDIYLNVIRCNR